MARKYLDAAGAEWDLIGEDDPRREQFAAEVEEMGFPSWETWNLDYTMVNLLYERVMLFRELGVMGNSDRMLRIGEEEHTFEQWVDELLVQCEEFFRWKQDFFPTTVSPSTRVWEIWKHIERGMWW